MARIVDYQETTTPANNDVLLIETEDGTRKVKKSVLLKAVNQKVTKTQAMIAQPFDESKSGGYAVGDVVTYGDKLYKFTSAHSGAWTGLDVELADVVGLMPNAIRIELDSTTTYNIVLTNIVDALQSLGINNLAEIKDCSFKIYSTITIGGTTHNDEIIYRLEEISGDNLHLSSISTQITQVNMSVGWRSMCIALNPTSRWVHTCSLRANGSSANYASYNDILNKVIPRGNGGYVEFIWT